MMPLLVKPRFVPETKGWPLGAKLVPFGLLGLERLSVPLLMKENGAVMLSQVGWVLAGFWSRLITPLLVNVEGVTLTMPLPLLVAGMTLTDWAAAMLEV